jgi:hypothetical protein
LMLMKRPVGRDQSNGSTWSTINKWAVGSEQRAVSSGQWAVSKRQDREKQRLVAKVRLV